MRPVDDGVDAGGTARVGESEHVALVCRGALQRERAEQLTPAAAQRLREPRLSGVLMSGRQHRRLIVEPSRGVEVRQRVVVQQRDCLRAEPVLLPLAVFSVVMTGAALFRQVGEKGIAGVTPWGRDAGLRLCVTAIAAISERKA